MKIEERIHHDNLLRVRIQELIDSLDCSSEERAIARQKLREAQHWLEEDLIAAGATGASQPCIPAPSAGALAPVVASGHPADPRAASDNAASYAARHGGTPPAVEAQG